MGHTRDSDWVMTGVSVTGDLVLSTVPEVGEETRQYMEDVEETEEEGGERDKEEILNPDQAGPHTRLEVSITSEDMKEIEGKKLIEALLQKHGFGVWTRQEQENEDKLAAKISV